MKAIIVENNDVKSALNTLKKEMKREGILDEFCVSGDIFVLNLKYGKRKSIVL